MFAKVNVTQKLVDMKTAVWATLQWQQSNISETLCTQGGKGCTPRMVETKIASTLHACKVSSAGHGITKRMKRPTVIEIAASPNFAGCISEEWSQQHATGD